MPTNPFIPKRTAEQRKVTAFHLLEQHKPLNHAQTQACHALTILLSRGSRQRTSKWTNPELRIVYPTSFGKSITWQIRSANDVENILAHPMGGDGLLWPTVIEELIREADFYVLEERSEHTHAEGRRSNNTQCDGLHRAISCAACRRPDDFRLQCEVDEVDYDAAHSPCRECYHRVIVVAYTYSTKTGDWFWRMHMNELFDLSSDLGGTAERQEMVEQLTAWLSNDSGTDRAVHSIIERAATDRKRLDDFERTYTSTPVVRRSSVDAPSSTKQQEE